MDELRKPLLSHLQELFARLRRGIFYLFIGFVAGYAVSEFVVEALEKPLIERLPAGAHLVFTTPFEKFWVYMRISLICGVLFVLPGLAWEVRGFVAPGLKRHERRRILWLFLSSAVVFALGLWVGFRFVLPPLIEAVLRFGSSDVMPYLTLSSYVNTTLGVLLATAIFLEVPVLMIHLSSWGWVQASVWSKGRRLSVVINAVASAILSPPDPASMIIMMIPLQILYEGGILGARVAQWWGHDSPNE
jgi:sec-independent protein translocase protein TatC